MAGCRSRRWLRSEQLRLRGGELLVGEHPGGMELAQLLQLLEIDGGRGSRGRSRCRGRLGLLLGCGGAFRVGLVVARLLLGLLAGPLLLLVVPNGTGGAGDDGGGGGGPQEGRAAAAHHHESISFVCSGQAGSAAYSCAASSSLRSSRTSGGIVARPTRKPPLLAIASLRSSAQRCSKSTTSAAVSSGSVSPIVWMSSGVSNASEPLMSGANDANLGSDLASSSTATALSWSSRAMNTRPTIRIVPFATTSLLAGRSPRS